MECQAGSFPQKIQQTGLKGWGKKDNMDNANVRIVSGTELYLTFGAASTQV